MPSALPALMKRAMSEREGESERRWKSFEQHLSGEIASQCSQVATATANVQECISWLNIQSFKAHSIYMRL